MDVMKSFDSLEIFFGLNGPSEPKSGPEPMEITPLHTKNRVENSLKTTSPKIRNQSIDSTISSNSIE